MPQFIASQVTLIIYPRALNAWASFIRPGRLSALGGSRRTIHVRLRALNALEALRCGSWRGSQSIHNGPVCLSRLVPFVVTMIRAPEK